MQLKTILNSNAVKLSLAIVVETRYQLFRERNVPELAGGLHILYLNRAGNWYGMSNSDISDMSGYHSFVVECFPCRACESNYSIALSWGIFTL